MNSYERVTQWLIEQEAKMNAETDPVEKRHIFVGFNSIKLNHKNWVKGQLDSGAYHFFCSDCEAISFPSGYGKEASMVEQQLCFYCELDKEREQEHLNKPKLIIGGVLYGDAGATSKANTKFNGFGGRVFKIRMLDGSKEWETNNLWCGGELPRKYRETTMKDNAEFVC